MLGLDYVLPVTWQIDQTAHAHQALETSQSRHNRVQDSLAPGEDNQAIR